MQFENAERRRDAMIGAALSSWNKKATRMEKEREKAQTLMDQMIAESKEREEMERQRMEDAAPWQGAMTGAGTGAAIGSRFGVQGALIGGGVGALAGGIFGAMQPDSVSRVAPYAAQVGQMAQMQQGQQANQEFMDSQISQRQDYMDLLRGGAGGGGGGGGLPRFNVPQGQRLSSGMQLRPPKF